LLYHLSYELSPFPSYHSTELEFAQRRAVKSRLAAFRRSFFRSIVPFPAMLPWGDEKSVAHFGAAQ
jgi:hypothetical protein